MVDRIANQTIDMEHGQPRTRNTKHHCLSHSQNLRQNSSSKWIDQSKYWILRVSKETINSNWYLGTTSLTSLNSNGSSRATRATKNPSFKSTKAVPKTRLRSPSPNSGPSSLPKTPRLVPLQIHLEYFWLETLHQVPLVENLTSGCSNYQLTLKYFDRRR